MSANQSTLTNRLTPASRLGQILATAAVYCAGAYLGHMLTVPGTVVALVYPPVGLMLAGVILFGRHIWPGIVIGACAMSMRPIFGQYPAATATAIVAGLSIADVLQVLLGAYWFERFAGTRNPLNRARDVLTFVVVAAVLSQAIGATLGAASLYLGGNVLWTELGRIWWGWWLSNVVSVLLITPFLLSWFRPGPRPTKRRFAKSGLVYGLTVLGAFLCFHLLTPTSHGYVEYFTMFFVIWAAFALGHTGTTAVTLIVASVAIWSTATGSGPFLSDSPEKSLLLLEVYLATLAIMGLVLAGVLTERHSEEEALRRREERYQALFDRSLNCVFLYDFEGNFLDANQAALDLLGYRREDIATVTFASLLSADQLPLAIQTTDDIRTTGHQKKPTEFRLRRKDGGHVMLETQSSLIYQDGKPLAIQGIARDITEPKRAEKALQTSQKRFRTIVEASPMGMHFYECGSDGHLVFSGANPSADKILGVDHARFVGRAIEEAFPGLVETEVPARYKEAAIHGTPWRTEQIDYREGAIKGAFEVVAFQTEPGKMAAMFNDITKRKRAEEKLQQMHLQLTHVARLSTLGEMAAELAHELNHPLYSILNYAKATRNVLAEEGPFNVESLREWNEEIAEIARSGADIIKRLRSFARRAESPRSPCRIEEIIEEAMGLVTFVAHKAQVVINTSFCEVPAVVCVDRVQIQQVLVNLLQNAAEAMDGTPAAMRRIAIRTTIVNHDVEVAISDRGEGLPPDEKARIFDAFVTTKPEGLGMGLTIAKTIVEAHGGRLWAVSNPQGGATFHCLLPLAKGD